MVSGDIAIRNMSVLSDRLTSHYPACVGEFSAGNAWFPWHDLKAVIPTFLLAT